MASATKPATTAVTDNDKLIEARRKDHEANLKATSDVPVSEQTASHALLDSDIESFGRRHVLTNAEAATALGRVRDGENENTVVADITDARSVYRQAYVKEPAGVAHPLAPVADVPVAPTPPTADELDPLTPKGDEPTAAVIDEDRVADAEERVAEYVDAVDETVAAVEQRAEDVEQA